MKRQFENACCPLCGGGRSEGLTTFSADFGSGVVMVRGVPALICDQCGEEWIENDAAMRLESIVADARQEGRLVEVLSY